MGVYDKLEGMQEQFKSVRHGQIVKLDLLSVTQTWEFIDHALRVVKDRTSGLKPDDVPDLFGAISALENAKEQIESQLDSYDEADLDRKLGKLLMYARKRVPYEHPAGPQITAALSLRNGDSGKFVTEVLKNTQDGRPPLPKGEPGSILDSVHKIKELSDKILTK